MSNSLSGIPAKLLSVFERVKTTVTITEKPTYSAATDDSTGTPTSHTVTNASPIIQDSAAFAPGVTTKIGDASCFLPGLNLGFVPLAGWTLTAGSGKPWMVVDVITHAVDEIRVAAYELRLER